MFDGVNLDGAFGERGGAFNGLHLVYIGGDEGLVGQVDAAEFQTGISRGGFECQGDGLARVQGCAFERGAFC